MGDRQRAQRAAPTSRPEPQGHDMVYHRLLEACGAQGCPICHLRNEGVRRYLDSLLYESVNDVGLRQVLLRSRGFCPAHAWELARFGDSLGIAIIYKDQMTEAIEAVRQALRAAGALRRRGPWHADGARHGSPAALLHRWRTPAAPCPACQIAGEATARYVSVLVQHLGDPGLRDAIDRSPFLCLPHLIEALERARTPDQARMLLELTETRLTRLHGDLAELIRKRDYRFAHEPHGEEETSWFRAIGQLVGWRGNRRA
jgi:hypothetical protein